MTHEKSENLKLSRIHVPHSHTPHYHVPHNHNHKHDFSNLGNGWVSGAAIASKIGLAPIAPMVPTLATIAMVAIPVVAIGGLIWWAASQDE